MSPCPCRALAPPPRPMILRRWRRFARGVAQLLVTSRTSRSRRLGARARRNVVSAKSFSLPSPACRHDRGYFYYQGAGIWADFLLGTDRLTGSIHAFGPPAFPICPTLPNFQSAFCHWPISLASSGRSEGSRSASGIGMGQGELRADRHSTRPTEFGGIWDSPRLAATASGS
jgi:hypothetical protein